MFLVLYLFIELRANIIIEIKRNGSYNNIKQKLLFIYYHLTKRKKLFGQLNRTRRIFIYTTRHVFIYRNISEAFTLISEIN